MGRAGAAFVRLSLPACVRRRVDAELRRGSTYVESTGLQARRTNKRERRHSGGGRRIGGVEGRDDGGRRGRGRLTIERHRWEHDDMEQVHSVAASGQDQFKDISNSTGRTVEITTPSLEDSSQSSRTTTTPSNPPCSASIPPAARTVSPISNECDERDSLQTS
jgi:hypothetical protein